MYVFSVQRIFVFEIIKHISLIYGRFYKFVNSSVISSSNALFSEHDLSTKSYHLTQCVFIHSFFTFFIKNLAKGHSYPLIALISFGWYLQIWVYLKMLYTRNVNALAALALIIPMLLTSEPFMGPSMKPKMCSIRHLVLDLVRLLRPCSSVSGWLRCPFSQIIGRMPHYSTSLSFDSQPASKYKSWPLSVSSISGFTTFESCTLASVVT